VNAIRHGGAANVAISLQPRGERLELAVQDDGKGFDMPAVSHSGMGIRIMRYRARVIGATLELVSRPGQGTRVCCVFSPVSRENLRGVKHDGHNRTESSTAR
jgi:two-component system, LuxR family, sensor kinase FixL